VAAQTGVPLSEVRLSEADKEAYYYYYWWRLRHCQKAEHELRLQGDLAADAARLVEFVGLMIGAENATASQSPKQIEPGVRHHGLR
jgi:hypothetical protein